MEYEVIVVGAGHAGCEAALACARKNHKTLLLTGNIKNIADMACNPSIGGSAKGIVVREIDALGGEMGKNTDKTLLQLKMLNTSKGPAVRALRAQADKVEYPKEMIITLQSTKNLEIKESIVEDLIVEDNKIKGAILEDGETVLAKVVILTTGTYMNSDILVGSTKTISGPHGEKTSQGLSNCLRNLGFKLLRLKTGTPQRIEKSSIDYSVLKEEKGDSELYTFSFDHEPKYKVEDQISCYLTYTTPETHKIINDNLDKSSMYGGFYEDLGTGPRYCPSIEDKIVRFHDKERHQLFLEPESIHYDDIYIQGFSTSMPYDVQEKMVHSLPGLENAIINKYAYAIEYDAIDPLQMKNSLESKIIENLYTAGQINGTSGYEEAAAQGLIAGINASLKLEGKEPLVLKRNEAYIGVLIDDLITKGTKEPYRLLTSRAEYRLLLRHDNADIRLRRKGYEVGLINDEQLQRLNKKEEQIEELITEFKTKKVNGLSIYDLLKRPENNLKDYLSYIDKEYSKEVLEQVEINIKYEGYINKMNKEAERMLKLEYKKIPDDIDYNKIKNLATEARQKLNAVRPSSIRQAMNISGVNPSDISILTIYMKRYFDE